VLVNVPDPAQLALHKLIDFGERTGSYRAKASKDLSQSASLLSYLWEHQRRTVATDVAFCRRVSRVVEDPS
jgi:hypothetical protein